MEKIKAYNDYNNILLDIQKVIPPIYRPSVVRINIDLQEYTLYRNGTLFNKDKRGASEPKLYKIELDFEE